MMALGNPFAQRGALQAARKPPAQATQRSVTAADLLYMHHTLYKASSQKTYHSISEGLKSTKSY